jgi:hypothetical protein
MEKTPKDTDKLPEIIAAAVLAGEAARQTVKVIKGKPFELPGVLVSTVDYIAALVAATIISRRLQK